MTSSYALLSDPLLTFKYPMTWILSPINQSPLTCQADRSDSVPTNMTWASLIIIYIVARIEIYKVCARIQLTSCDSWSKKRVD